MSLSPIRHCTALLTLQRLCATLLCLFASPIPALPSATSSEPLHPSPRARDLGQQGLVEFTQGLITVVALEQHSKEASALAQSGAEVLPKLEQDLHQKLERPLTMVLLPKVVPASLQRLEAQGPHWATGFVLPLQRVGAIRMHRITNYPFNGSAMVLTHEISHQLMHDKLGRGVPRWFDEAVATRAGRRRGTSDALRYATSRLLSRVPPIASLDRAFAGSESEASKAYLVSFEFLTWAERINGPDFVAQLLDTTAYYQTHSRVSLDMRTNFQAAWQDTTGFPLTISEQQWRQSTLRWTRWLPVVLTSNSLWVAMALLSFVAFLARRRRTQEQYQRWDEEEALAARRLGTSSIGPSSAKPLQPTEPASTLTGPGEGPSDKRNPPVN